MAKKDNKNETEPNSAEGQPQTSSLDTVLQQNQALIEALIASRAVGSTPNVDPTDPPTRVENIRGASVSFDVTDPRTGGKLNVMLEKRGDFKLIRRSQVLEAQEKYPHFFEKGFLSAPEVIEAGVNTIVNMQSFIDGLSYEEINDKIDEITSLAVCYDLFNHIESLRFTHLDESGKPLMRHDEVSNRMVPELREIKLSPKYATVELALQRRISELTNGIVAQR